MKRALAIEFSRVTEAAALAGFAWLGRGDKNAADAAAVKAMRTMLNQIEMNGEIVIGEGEIDEAPMLYIGEKLGKGGNEEDIAIAVDPIEGTRMVAMGQANAIAVLAAGGKETFLRAPDMYMEKLVVGPEVKGMIDLNLPLEQNLRRVASKLDKPRHQTVIYKMQQLGVKVLAIPDGDVAAALLCCLPDTGVDMMYCIGGAPEGVVAAAGIRALGGDIQARLLTREVVKGDSEENRAFAESERRRCQEMGVEVNKVLTLDQLVRDDNLVFSATGITHGDLLKGVHRKGDVATTETLLIRGHSRTIRRIQSFHYLDRKDPEIYRLINE